MHVASDTLTDPDLLAGVERIRPVIEADREQIETERRLTDGVYDAMVDAGLFRTLAPKAFGGLQLHPVEAYKVWEAVARIDSAAGWNLQISSAASGFAAWLPEEGGAEVYSGGPDTIFAGAFFPPGPGTRVDGGWKLTARLPFASGCHRAAWLMFAMLEMDGDAPKVDPATGQPTPMLAFVPRAEAEIIDTWHTVGMRGTFSADIAVNDVFVPDRRVSTLVPLEHPAPAFGGPLYPIMPWPGAHGETIVSLGVAGAAIDALVTLASKKTPAYSTTALKDRAMAQHHAARARALLDASREYLFSAISEAYATAERGDRLSQDTKIRCQLSACFAAEACAEAVDLVHEAAGTSAIRLGKGFERHHRDIHVLTQHASKSYSRYEDVGKMLFGLPQTWFVLNL